MAALGVLEAILGSLPTDVKKALVEYTRAWAPSLRMGPLDTAKAENFAGYKVASTTGSDTGEFSVEHGMGFAPYAATPWLDLTAVGSAIVPLTVTRAADDRRVYFKTDAGSTSKPFVLYLEG